MVTINGDSINIGGTFVGGSVHIGGSAGGMNVGGRQFGVIQGGNISISNGSVAVGGRRLDINSLRYVQDANGNRIGLGPKGSGMIELGGVINVLSRGNSANINGAFVEHRMDGRIYINGEQVPYPYEQEGAPEGLPGPDPFAELKERFPGVHFEGTPGAARIDSSVRIAAGATVILSPNLELRGNTSISANSVVADAKLEDCEVVHSQILGGRATNSTFDRSTMSENAQVVNCSIRGESAVGGNASLIDTTVDGGGSVTGQATIRSSKILGGASVRGVATVSGSEILGGSSVRGSATVRDSKVFGGSSVRGSATVQDSSLGYGSSVRGSATVKRSHPGERVELRDSERLIDGKLEAQSQYGGFGNHGNFNFGGFGNRKSRAANNAGTGFAAAGRSASSTAQRPVDWFEEARFIENADTPWSILGVPKDADAKTVKTAYRQLSKRFHPDYNQDRKDVATRIMTRLNEAYELMSA